MLNDIFWWYWVIKKLSLILKNICFLIINFVSYNVYSVIVFFYVNFLLFFLLINMGFVFGINKFESGCGLVFFSKVNWRGLFSLRYCYV